MYGHYLYAHMNILYILYLYLVYTHKQKDTPLQVEDQAHPVVRIDTFRT